MAETYEPYTVTSDEFKKLVPEYTNNFEQMVDDYVRVVEAVQREFKKLNEMKDGGSSKKGESPTALARKELLNTYRLYAEDVIFDSVDYIVDEVARQPESGIAFAEVLREWADHLQFMGDLHAQNLRNKKYAGSSETDEDAVAQRLIVNRLLKNVEKFEEVAPMLGKTLPEKDVPTMRGNKVGTNSTGVRQSSAYPVLELNMEFSVDGESLGHMGISDAVINYLFPALGKFSYGLDIEHSIIEALKKENPNWTGAGQTTVLYFERGELEPVEFSVHIVQKFEKKETDEDADS